MLPLYDWRSAAEPKAGQQFTTAPVVFTAPVAACASSLLSRFLGLPLVARSPASTIFRHPVWPRALQVSGLFRRILGTSRAGLGGARPSEASRKRPPVRPSCRLCFPLRVAGIRLACPRPTVLRDVRHGLVLWVRSLALYFS